MLISINTGQDMNPVLNFNVAMGQNQLPQTLLLETIHLQRFTQYTLQHLPIRRLGEELELATFQPWL